MKTIKVKSANYSYLIMGIFTSLIFIFGIVSIILYSNQNILETIFILFLPTILIIIVSYILLNAYKNRKEINFYVIEKTGIINFNKLNEKYIQVKDDGKNLFFVEKKDYSYYCDFNLFYDITKYV